MMKLPSSAAIVVVFVVLAASGIECRPHPRRHGQMLFVFGDSFVDAGNIAQTSEKSVMSRQWFYPYGSSDRAHGKDPTGRLSDGLVQSDYLAKILGHDESPPPYRLVNDDDVDPSSSGVNFAVAGAGMYEDSGSIPVLSQQIGQLKRLVNRGDIEERDLDGSVALIAFHGGRDYAGITRGMTSDQIMSFSDKVTDEIIHGVKSLQKLGVSKVIVNTLPPLGCAPFMAQINDYATCDTVANTASNIHNSALTNKLDQLDDVLLLDINSVFHNLARGNYRACCADSSVREGGYCGREDSNGRAQYTVCSGSDHRDFFYWDFMHPTQTAWNRVMNNLQTPIQDFLGI